MKLSFLFGAEDCKFMLS